MSWSDILKPLPSAVNLERIPKNLRNFDVKESYLLRNLTSGFVKIRSEWTMWYPFLYLLGISVLAVIGPHIAPYPYDQTIIGAEGVPRAAGPSMAHPLGTTYTGQDVLSRIVYGARPSVLTGAVGGGMIITVGLTIGTTAGYVGGAVEEVLMRLTDIAYSLPLIPFAIVMVAFVGIGFWTSIFIIGAILWRSSARVLRSQVLQIKQRPYIKATKALGASRSRIVIKHILPNIASMAVLFFALGVGYSIIIQAGLAFIGVSNPFLPSWGVMIRNAYDSGYMSLQPFWSILPGVMISLTVLSAFLLGRGFEEADDSDYVI